MFGTLVQRLTSPVTSPTTVRRTSRPGHNHHLQRWGKSPSLGRLTSVSLAGLSSPGWEVQSDPEDFDDLRSNYSSQNLIMGGCVPMIMTTARKSRAQAKSLLMSDKKKANSNHNNNNNVNINNCNNINNSNNNNNCNGSSANNNNQHQVNRELKSVPTTPINVNNNSKNASSNGNGINSNNRGGSCSGSVGKLNGNAKINSATAMLTLVRKKCNNSLSWQDAAFPPLRGTKSLGRLDGFKEVGPRF